MIRRPPTACRPTACRPTACRPTACRPGLLLALWALLVQLCAGAIVPVQAAVLDPAALLAAGAICHVETGEGQQGQAPASPNDCALCPLCLVAALPAAVPVPAPTIPAPRLIVLPAYARPAQPRAPPAVPLVAAWPRGPPALS